MSKERTHRSHYCEELNIEHIGESITVSGWVHRRRDHGGVIFIDLRDTSGILQLVFDPSNKELFAEAEKIRSEYVVSVSGNIRNRPEGTVNPDMVTGEIELLVESGNVLNPSLTPPFHHDESANEDTRLKYRYLDLRRKKMSKNLKLRHQIIKTLRNFLDADSFIEIETPILTKATPEGARDYLVPSRLHHGKFYALPQSPQIYKQILMISAYDRYFQIVKCFRDEDLRADRQPEFTQIDCEMTFVEQEDILNQFEGLTRHLIKEIRGIEIESFPRISYEKAMKTYGNDKPDIRFGMKFVELNDLTQGKGFDVFDSQELVVGIAVPGAASYSRKEIDALIDWVKRPQIGAKGLVWVKCNDDGKYKSSVDKFFTESQIATWAERSGAITGDLILILSGEVKTTRSQLSALRMELAERMDLRDPEVFAPIWVTDFPLLEWDKETERFHAMHHPFTAPKSEHIELLKTNPGKVNANAYDLVLNGNEIGGGSIRIHDQKLQSQMFELLGFSKQEAKEQFGFLMDAFNYGAPPHGGIAFGLDRLVAILGGEETIRDFIAFPKNNSGRDVMIDAPAFINDTQLKELFLKTLPKNKE